MLPMSAPIHSSALICKHSLGSFKVTYVGVLHGLFEVVYVCAPWVLFCGIHFFEDSVHDEGCKEEGAEVSNRLRDLNSQKTKGWGQN